MPTSQADFEKTAQEFTQAIALCRNIFIKKLEDYGPAWRILRTESLTDQIFIKANRIRSFETKGVQKINESVVSEYIGIVNYAIMALIQLELGFADQLDLTKEEALNYYDKHSDAAQKLMTKKNHDYDEAWRNMRVTSYTDLILMKLFRVKQIEDNRGETLISEGVDANYHDIINYAVFALIKLDSI